ncbi:right-handed parallel beta-helix repeat-containing protein [Streptomyces sp. NPDC051018]|uniref:right-handed parallel beta-helix repeat-containing protein n=1 Tax=Streptomyces sp. NPDC051018 TaxID=3365639 RepID=UPI00379934DA
MRKLYALLPALAAVAAVFPATPSHAASTLIVGQNPVTCPGQAFMSIQAAVNAAVSGDTVQVCPGLYAEIVTITTPNLTLTGATTPPADCDVVTAPDPTTDSIIATTNVSDAVVNLMADNLTLQGFTIQNGGAGPATSGVFTSHLHSGYSITDNLIQNNLIGIYLNTTSPATQSEVARNCIRQNNLGTPAAGNGIYSDQGIHNVLIDNNAFFQNVNDAMLITQADPFTVDNVNINHNVSHQDGRLLTIFASTNSVVTDNTVVDATDQAITIGNENTGLQILRNGIQGGGLGIFSTSAFVPTAPGSSQVTISDNTISGTSGDGVSLDVNSLADSTISNNSVTDAGRDGVFIDDTTGNDGNTVTGNTLTGSARFDCEDLTTGTGTAGTANTWTSNQAQTSNPAALCPVQPPSLTISKTHEGDFKAGKQGTYTITAGNAGPGPTDGSTVTVTDVLPRGLTAVSMTGTGWTCDVTTLTCTRSDTLAAGATYPPITLVVDVPCECKSKRGGGGCEPRKGIDTVTVTGGGDSTTHTATDPTTIKGSEHCKKPKDDKKPTHHR